MKKGVKAIKAKNMPDGVLKVMKVEDQRLNSAGWLLLSKKIYDHFEALKNLRLRPSKPFLRAPFGPLRDPISLNGIVLRSLSK